MDGMCVWSLPGAGEERFPSVDISQRVAEGRCVGDGRHSPVPMQVVRDTVGCCGCHCCRRRCLGNSRALFIVPLVSRLRGGVGCSEQPLGSRCGFLRGGGRSRCEPALKLFLEDPQALLELLEGSAERGDVCGILSNVRSAVLRMTPRDAALARYRLAAFCLQRDSLCECISTPNPSEYQQLQTRPSPAAPSFVDIPRTR